LKNYDRLSREPFVGNSPAFHRLNDQIQKAALTDVPVLITGESGTGKELAAKLLHHCSAQRALAFFKVRCPAISNQFFERELFQATNRGSIDLTAWTTEKPIEALPGTLFLDEIGELDPSLQGKLLHGLQEVHLSELNRTNNTPINIRLICSTTRDLEAEISKGSFRADLFYRINVLRIHLPPLRDRVADVPILMNHFINTYSAKFGKDPIPTSPSFVRSLESYRWPGNVRELENMAKRYVVLGGEKHVLSVMQHPEEPGTSKTVLIDLTTPLKIQTRRAVQHLESKIILGVLEAHNWNRRKTARSLDISYRTLLHKIKEGGLPQSSRS
jgi:DNA-binding NtrC family response regulator